AFTGKSLTDPPLEQWKVKRDGGAFDQLTGATITPRAVVKAVRRFLEYVQKHQEQLFAPAAGAK
ncbi:MAG: FMN-binding protein, partial [Candidatus Competibacteraceae bacterium]|nr:FMN-binding protein [Candidatus Competibacteraceae bacterium]